MMELASNTAQKGNESIVIDEPWACEFRAVVYQFRRPSFLVVFWAPSFPSERPRCVSRALLVPSSAPAPSYKGIHSRPVFSPVMIIIITIHLGKKVRNCVQLLLIHIYY